MEMEMLHKMLIKKNAWLPRAASILVDNTILEFITRTRTADGYVG